MKTSEIHRKEQLNLTEQNVAHLLPRPFGQAGKLWLAFLIMLCLAGITAYIYQLRYGLAITGMHDYTSWGIYIATFVFFVAVSLVGALISAILKLTGTEWRLPLTRIAEIIAVASILMASIIIVIDMGRPDRLLNIFLYGRIQSPISWDVAVIFTYLVISMLMLYIPMIPDLAMCRDNLTDIPGWQKKMYRVLSLNWRGDHSQIKRVMSSVIILAVLVIPVAFAIHTVTSWLFATTFRPGWDSTNFGAYFVSGAFMVGTACVIALAFILNRAYNYREIITPRHFDYSGKLLHLMAVVYLYFNINEYLVPGFKLGGLEADFLRDSFTGDKAALFWTTQIGGLFLPIIVLVFKRFRKPLPLFIISLIVIAGAWLKRYLIVIPTQQYTFTPIQNVPVSWTWYQPTFPEWIITAGTVSGVLLLITLFIRWFPALPVWEMSHEQSSNQIPKTSAQEEHPARLRAEQISEEQ
jgi:Ni/Fe-hydrogenase subunit HybB-like protein